MQHDANVLLLCLDGTECEWLRQALPVNGAFRAQCVRRMSTALARIAGGGIDAGVIDVSPGAAFWQETRR